MPQPAVTPVKLLLHRITLICGACMFFACAGCFDTGMHSQDACINIYTDKPGTNNLIQVDSSVAYDTILSTLTCILPKGPSGNISKDVLLHLYQNQKEILTAKTNKDTVELGLLTGGTYNYKWVTRVNTPVLIYITFISLPAPVAFFTPQ